MSRPTTCQRFWTLLGDNGEFNKNDSYEKDSVQNDSGINDTIEKNTHRYAQQGLYILFTFISRYVVFF